MKEKKDDINYEEINLPSLKQLEFIDDKEYDKNILISDSLKSYYQSNSNSNIILIHQNNIILIKGTFDKRPIVTDDKDGDVNHIMEPIIYNNYISIESAETPENNIITTDDEFIDSYYSTF